jgi:formate C-acetyltransferase
MNPRVAELRRESIEATPSLSAERAILTTDFYRRAPEVCPDASPAVLRGLAFRHLMENQEIHVGRGELIVGERGPRPKAAPTYPELCCHSHEDLRVLDSRERIAFKVDPETFRVYEEEITPFWRGRTVRDQLFAAMTDEWKAAYEAGIFTEFMEQRAPGHTVAGDKIYKKGFRDLIAEIDERLARLDAQRRTRPTAEPADTSPAERDQREELRAMRICAEAIIRFAERHAEKARSMAGAETDPARRAEILHVAEVCRRVPANAPRDFHEALQAYWFVHLGVITELNTWDAFNPGRLDQLTTALTPWRSRSSTPSSKRSTAGPTGAAGSTGSTCSRPPATSTSARSPAPPRMGGGPGNRYRKASPRSRAPTGADRRPS